jgi:hypothetical protein
MLFDDPPLPVPVDRIAEDLLGLQVERDAALGDVSGALYPATRRIVVNANEEETRQRFTLAHEFGHWVCQCLTGMNAAVFCRHQDLAASTDRALEREANAFAAELVMPEAEVRTAFAEEATSAASPPASASRRLRCSGGCTASASPTVLDKLVAGGLRNGRWRVFYDPNQNLFNGIGGSAMERLLSLNPFEVPLKVNCRNTEQIATATSMFSGCPSLNSSIQRPKVETLWYRDEGDQRRTVTNCVRRLLSQGVRPAEIVILSTRTLKNRCLKDGWSSDFGAGLIELSTAARDESVVQFSTITAFKGLESDVVVLLDAVSASPSSRYLTYVGASRARLLLTLLLDESAGEEIAERYARFGDTAAAELAAASQGEGDR